MQHFNETPGRGSFADRVNRLFDSVRPPGMKEPYTSEEVAFALQEQGIPLSAQLLSRLRAGLDSHPSETTMAAIAFFFDISPAYFTDDAHASEVEREWAGTSTVAPPEPLSAEGHRGPPGRDPVSPPSARQGDVVVPLEDFGRCLSGLSDAALACLDQSPPNNRVIRRLAQLLSEAGSLLARTREDTVRVPRSFLEQVVLSWAAAGPGKGGSLAAYLRAAELLGGVTDSCSASGSEPAAPRRDPAPATGGELPEARTGQVAAEHPEPLGENEEPGAVKPQQERQYTSTGRIFGENSFYKLDWNPPRGSIPRGCRNPVTDMDEAHTSWGRYAKRQHRPDEQGWYLATFTDLDGVETTLYHGPSPHAPYNECIAHKKRMIDQLGLDL